MKDTPDHDLSKDRLRLWLRLLKVSRAIEGQLRERLRDRHDSTLPRFDVMAALYRTPEGLRMSALSDALRVSNGNVTGIVDRLVRDGLVERAQVESDRRAFSVRLTPQGRAAFADLAAVHENWIDEMLSGLDGDAVARLTSDLARIETDRKGTP